MIHQRTLAKLAVLVSFTAQLSSAFPTQAVPEKYTLQPGLELNYHAQVGEWFDGADGKPTILLGDDGKPKYAENRCALYVLNENADGSFRVVWRTITAAGDEALSWADLFPSGKLRTIRAATPILEFDSLRTLFPRLPSSREEQARGWSESESETGIETRFTVRDGWIHADFCGPLDRIAAGTWSVRYRLDPRTGLPHEARSNGRWEKYGETHESQTVLDSTFQHDAKWIAAFARDAELYFTAVAEYQRLQRVNHVRRAAAERERAGAADESIGAAIAVLAVAHQACGDSIFATRLAKKIEDAEQNRAANLQTARQWSRFAGLPVPAWSADDLHGVPHASADYRGQVVVLDFWFRQCSFCMRAMPQVEKTAALFRGEGAPVVFLAASVDDDVADARFVAEQLHLEYPVLQAKKLAELCGVTAYPTLLVVAPDGTLQGIFLGYNPLLGDNLTECIRGLLPAR